MNSPERLPSETHKPITGYLWGALAVLTCPCHLPILAIVLAGTTGPFFKSWHQAQPGALVRAKCPLNSASATVTVNPASSAG